MILAMALACSTKNGANKEAQEAGTDSTAVAENVAEQTATPAAPAKPINPKKLLPSKAQKDTVSYLLGINFGSFLKNYSFGDLNYSQIVKGMKDFLAAKGNPQDSNFVKQFKINPEIMQVAVNMYLTKMQDYTKAVNVEKEAKYLAANLKKEGVQETESGLQYQILESGEGKISVNDTLFVHYKGTLPDGSVFDEVKPEAPAVQFNLNRVVEGWKEGMQLVGNGGKIILVLPSKLGYGENGTRGIEPNTPLTFEVTVDSVHVFVEPVAEPENK